MPFLFWEGSPGRTPIDPDRIRCQPALTTRLGAAPPRGVQNKDPVELRGTFMQPTMQPTVRFFCYADASDLGVFALAYVDAMTELEIPVRLVATRCAQMSTFHELGGRGLGWTRHRGLFLTPIDHKIYVNMVCGDAMDQRRLYTVGVTNVLLTMHGPYPDADDTKTVLQYERLIVPTADLAHAWKAVGGSPVVVPLDWASAELTLRAAVAP